jgi:hypothetical protein
MAKRYDQWTRARLFDKRFDKRFRYACIFGKAAETTEDLDGDDDAAHAAALHHLFHTAAGTALLRRVFPSGPGSIADVEHLARLLAHVLRNSKRPAPRDPHQPWPDGEPEVTAKGFPMNRADELETLVKRAGSFAGLCKSIAAGRHGDVSEWELATMARGYAMKRYPGLSPERAFTKQYGDERMSDEARAFWDACDVAKGLRPARTEPEVTRGRAAVDVNDPEEVLRQYAQLLAEQRQRTRLAEVDDDDDDDERGEESALDELQVKAAALRKRMPQLSEAQAFAKVYQDPTNIELRRRERKQNGFAA